jgi:AcrR family transcriptional regulator
LTGAREAFQTVMRMSRDASEGDKEVSEGRRARRQRETRQALVVAALDLIRVRGVYGTRIEDITERADVGKGVFYNYFASKEALVAALVTTGIELLERDYLGTLKVELALAERVAGLARLHERFFEEHPEFALVLHQARGLLLLETEEATPLRSAFSDYLARLSRHLQGGAARGRESNDLEEAAALLAGATSGYHSFCGAVGRAANVTKMARMLVSGLPDLLHSTRKARRRGDAHKRAKPPK